ncbi:hypothetical protein E5Q_01691 [Mixia osmundae IAM 14324]|uniref:Uncharacterized protein n=2 Tax=Mixia osmundae (strain CBS 9802 / IAM 14324 / JCM 22182 / KY 12970) TaxID=764103 RepID=G7DWT9_MIXOS|nr:hypothetical protein E5Q_01691 [Mixia osmundae IAM 14324]
MALPGSSGLQTSASILMTPPLTSSQVDEGEGANAGLRQESDDSFQPGSQYSPDSSQDDEEEDDSFETELSDGRSDLTLASARWSAHEAAGSPMLHRQLSPIPHPDTEASFPAEEFEQHFVSALRTQLATLDTTPIDLDAPDAALEVPGEPDLPPVPQEDVPRLRYEAAVKLRTTWDDIAAKYSRPEYGEDQDDIIDIETGDIIKDRGRLRALSEDQNDDAKPDYWSSRATTSAAWTRRARETRRKRRKLGRPTKRNAASEEDEVDASLSEEDESSGLSGDSITKGRRRAERRKARKRVWKRGPYHTSHKYRWQPGQSGGSKQLVESVSTKPTERLPASRTPSPFLDARYWLPTMRPSAPPYMLEPKLDPLELLLKAKSETPAPVMKAIKTETVKTAPVPAKPVPQLPSVVQDALKLLHRQNAPLPSLPDAFRSHFSKIG